MTERIDMRMPDEGAICDFCSSPDVHWSFPARDFVRNREVRGMALHTAPALIEFSEGSFTHGSHGGWAACNVCHRLIVRGDRVKLTRRSAKAILRKHPDARMSLANAITLIRPLHDDFWRNRQGAPIYHAQRPQADPTA